MNVYRPLHATLTDLADDLIEATALMPLRTTSVEMSLPLELRLSTEGELLGGLPLFRQRTRFDAEPSRLTLTLAEVAT